MRLYHVTGPKAARAILADGFRDGEGTYLTTHAHRGVWLSDDPIAVQASGASWGGDDTILEVQLDVPDDGALAEFEWIEEGRDGPPIVGRNYREWLVPAAWVNAHAVPVAVVEDDDALFETLERERKPIPPLERS